MTHPHSKVIPSPMHDEKRPGDVLKVPGDPLDDVADDVRYGIYTFITSTSKPEDLALRDECRALAQQGDLTSALIHYQHKTAEPVFRPLGWADTGHGVS